MFLNAHSSGLFIYIFIYVILKHTFNEDTYSNKTVCIELAKKNHLHITYSSVLNKKFFDFHIYLIYLHVEI